MRTGKCTRQRIVAVIVVVGSRSRTRTHARQEENKVKHSNAGFEGGGGCSQGGYQGEKFNGTSLRGCGAVRWKEDNLGIETGLGEVGVR